MNEENINISEIFQVLKRKYKLIVAIVIGFVAVAGVLSFFVITPKYEAKVKLFIGKEESKDNLGYNSSEIQMYQKLLTTYAEIIKTEDLVQGAVTKANIDLGKMEAKDVLSSLVVTPRSDTQILEIGYKDSNPQRAVDIVNSITNNFISKSKKLITNGNVQIIEKAKVPENPVSPNKKLNILISLVLGLMVGVGIVLLLEFMDNTFKSKEDLEKVLDLPVIGAIPEYDTESIRGNNHIHNGRSNRKSLRDNLGGRENVYSG
ncbi:YveK family protein [uncultured Clostridium sp.]|uniref:YveK family protein n=1 Tax=uncultured Clostridium sp. TaxID=59620 RepID=UPI00258CB7B3|nr:Wzz/FepE/Etk N-terminal domain-containing protein [uncultured Clostridium sp.]